MKLARRNIRCYEKLSPSAEPVGLHALARAAPTGGLIAQPSPATSDGVLPLWSTEHHPFLPLTIDGLVRFRDVREPHPGRTDTQTVFSRHLAQLSNCLPGPVDSQVPLQDHEYGVQERVDLNRSRHLPLVKQPEYLCKRIQGCELAVEPDRY